MSILLQFAAEILRFDLITFKAMSNSAGSSVAVDVDKMKTEKELLDFIERGHRLLKEYGKRDLDLNELDTLEGYKEAQRIKVELVKAANKVEVLRARAKFAERNIPESSIDAERLDLSGCVFPNCSEVQNALEAFVNRDVDEGGGYAAPGLEDTKKILSELNKEHGWGFNDDELLDFSANTATAVIQHMRDIRVKTFKKVLQSHADSAIASSSSSQEPQSDEGSKQTDGACAAVVNLLDDDDDITFDLVSDVEDEEGEELDEHENESAENDEDDPAEADPELEAKLQRNAARAAQSTEAVYKPNPICLYVQVEDAFKRKFKNGGSQDFDEFLDDEVAAKRPRLGRETVAARLQANFVPQFNVSASTRRPFAHLAVGSPCVDTKPSASTDDSSDDDDIQVVFDSRYNPNNEDEEDEDEEEEESHAEGEEDDDDVEIISDREEDEEEEEDEEPSELSETSAESSDDDDEVEALPNNTDDALPPVKNDHFAAVSADSVDSDFVLLETSDVEAESSRDFE